MGKATRGAVASHRSVTAENQAYGLEKMMTARAANGDTSLTLSMTKAWIPASAITEAAGTTSETDYTDRRLADIKRLMSERNYGVATLAVTELLLRLKRQAKRQGETELAAGLSRLCKAMGGE